MKLKKQEIDARLSKLSDWLLVEDSIKKDFKLKDFPEAMAFVVKIALEAERVQHHPDITIEYNRVKIVLTTHSEEGLTTKDFDLAEKIEKFIGA
ncbi:MAG TPA: 4a-hydroxytetrahydrobiopterin dehydratase [Candidatus Kryptobacter bacterium]|nr:MAG: 4a-hydroxytetrahydrobiopterin dehydratase [Ignavibacteriae bacterium 37-53-5]HQT91193.1 4a-hydroxytetrahydrobiopterin dehydratase [Candidatus Kryptobacter bacterium]